MDPLKPVTDPTISKRFVGQPEIGPKPSCGTLRTGQRAPIGHFPQQDLAGVISHKPVSGELLFADHRHSRISAQADGGLVV